VVGNSEISVSNLVPEISGSKVGTQAAKLALVKWPPVV